MQIGGPIWSDPIHDKDFVVLLKAELEASKETVSEKDITSSYGTWRRMEGILQLASEEIPNCPLYYQLDRLCSLANCRMPSIKVFRSAILNAGYQVSYSHALKNSLKTNAPNDLIWSIMKVFIKSEKAKLKETDSAFTIFNKDFLADYEICLDVAESEEPASISMNLLRYQRNPEEDWGPKAKPNSEGGKRKRNQGKKSKKQMKLDHQTGETVTESSQ